MIVILQETEARRETSAGLFLCAEPMCRQAGVSGEWGSGEDRSPACVIARIGFATVWGMMNASEPASNGRH